MENLRIKIQAELRKYINDKHNQDECSGFIDGIDAVFELLKSEGKNNIKSSEPHLPLGDVSGSLRTIYRRQGTTEGFDSEGNNYYIKTVSNDR